MTKTTITALDVAKMYATEFLAKVTDDNDEFIGMQITEDLTGRHRDVVDHEAVYDIIDDVSEELFNNGCGAPTEADICNAILELKEAAQ